jgi:arylsulfatase A-like enzyme
VPGLTPKAATCDRTVDFMSIYPTLCDVAGLPIPQHVEGKSIKPLLEHPDMAWDQPAITTHGYKNHAVRTERWRYIHYADGSEELYDHEADPYEWTNLAVQPDKAKVIAELSKWLPENNAPPKKVAKTQKAGVGNKRQGANKQKQRAGKQP